MSRRILFVNDDFRARREAEKFLNIRDYQTIIAEDGEDALKKLEDERKAGRSIDLIITDIRMPKMDGFELIEQLRGSRQYSGHLGIVSGTYVERDFIADKKIFYDGCSLLTCLEAYQKISGDKSEAS